MSPMTFDDLEVL